MVTTQEDYQNIRYEKNYLSNVVCKLDFYPVSFLKEDISEEISSFIKQYCPEFEKNKVVEFKSIIDSDGTKKDHQDEFPLFVYKNIENTIVIHVRNDYILIDFFNYNNFTEFKEVVFGVLDIFIEKYNIKRFNRLGLRYINQIKIKKGSPFIWNGYIDSSLVSVVEKFFARDKALARCMSQAIFAYDDYKINFSYGMFNSDFPARISRKEFVLDYDCYTEYVEKEEIHDKISFFNKKIKELFEKSIKIKLRNEMVIRQ